MCFEKSLELKQHKKLYLAVASQYFPNNQQPGQV